MIIYFVGHKNVIKVDLIRYLKLKDFKKKQFPLAWKASTAAALLSGCNSRSQRPVSRSTLNNTGRLISIHWSVIGPPMRHASTRLPIVKPAF